MLHSYLPGGPIHQKGWSGGTRWFLEFVVPLSLRTLHCHAQPSGRAAAGGGVPAVGQVRHTGGTGMLCAVTCKHRVFVCKRGSSPRPGSTLNSFRPALLLPYMETDITEQGEGDGCKSLSRERAAGKKTDGASTGSAVRVSKLPEILDCWLA